MILPHCVHYHIAGASNGSSGKAPSPMVREAAVEGDLPWGQRQAQPPKSPISIQPLDTTTSLPTKMANLDLTSIYPADGSERGTKDESSLQAYQPGREGQPSWHPCPR